MKMVDEVSPLLPQAAQTHVTTRTYQEPFLVQNLGRRGAKVFEMIIAALLFVLFLEIIIPKSRYNRGSTVPEPLDVEYGVGFDLTTSYGTAAISYSNGTTTEIARKDAGEDYQEMMIRLSSQNAQHLHPPYNWIKDENDDMPRQLLRKLRKLIGLPANKDAGLLAELIRPLRTKVEEDLGHRISSAAVTVPELWALYEEDLRAAFDYLGMHFVEIYKYRDQLIPEPAAVYAGNKIGLDYNGTSPSSRNEDPVTAPHESGWDLGDVLSVSFTRHCLITCEAFVDEHYAAHVYPHYENYNLGYDPEKAKTNWYWEAVRDAILMPIVTRNVHRNVTKVFVYGESADEPAFNKVLNEAVRSVMDNEPEFYRDDPLFVAAKGAAELGRRANLKRKEGIYSDK